MKPDELQFVDQLAIRVTLVRVHDKLKFVGRSIRRDDMQNSCIFIAYLHKIALVMQFRQALNRAMGFTSGGHGKLCGTMLDAALNESWLIH